MSRISIKYVVIFVFLSAASVTHAFPPAPIPQTGQTTCFDTAGTAITCAGTGQDGELQNGMPWPNPRFTDNANGTITDNLTGLIWLKNANCFSTQLWSTAVASARLLASGQCGLTDSSTSGQWRLPSGNELESLVNEQQANPAIWLNTQGFTSVQVSNYWSGSTYATYTSRAWYVGMDLGYINIYYGNKTYSYYVWPVRSGP